MMPLNPAPAAASGVLTRPRPWPVERLVLAGQRARSPRTVYLAAAGAWFITRLFVALYQGQWPWMNAFVVQTATNMLGGQLDDAVRPPLPSVLAIPLIVAGLDEQATVTTLYVIVSMIQFGAFLLFTRALFPDRMREQTLALLLFLVVPYNHSIHHWRNVPVVLASSGTFLVLAHWLRAHHRGLTSTRDVWSPRSVGWIVGSVAMGVASRTEVLTLVGGLVLLGVVVYRRQIASLALLYTLAAVVGIAANFGLLQVTGADLTNFGRYQVHTFLDSTPASWLTESCRMYPSEDCREADGWTYFPEVDQNITLPQLIARHPWTAVAKTFRSALDNLWELFGVATSTYPGYAWFAILVPLFLPAYRVVYRRVPKAAWLAGIAVLGVTVLPPLAWAPAHPQYHLHSLAGVTIVIVPLLAALQSQGISRLLFNGFVIGSALLSAVRYTRYPGY